MEHHDAHCIAALKYNSELSMAHYDDLPPEVRREIANALVNADDLPQAASLGILHLPAAELVEMVRNANRSAYLDGVFNHGVAPGQRSFRLRARGAGRPDRIERLLVRQRRRQPR